MGTTEKPVNNGGMSKRYRRTRSADQDSEAASARRRR
jgi:hypothetical protein